MSNEDALAESLERVLQPEPEPKPEPEHEPASRTFSVDSGLTHQKFKAFDEYMFQRSKEYWRSAKLWQRRQCSFDGCMCVGSPEHPRRKKKSASPPERELSH